MLFQSWNCYYLLEDFLGDSNLALRKSSAFIDLYFYNLSFLPGKICLLDEGDLGRFSFGLF